MPSKRIDELDARVVADADLLPVTPSGGPSGKATVAAIVAEGLSQPNSASAGAGASITIKAADGVTSGAGGSIVLQPGAQATTGGNGTIYVRSGAVGDAQILPAGTHDLTIRVGNTSGSDNGVFTIARNYASTSGTLKIQPYSASATGSGALISGAGNISFWPKDSASTDDGSSFVQIYRRSIHFRNLNPAGSYDFGVALRGSGSNGVICVFNGTSTTLDYTNGGSIAYKSSSLTITTNQNDYVLTGSAFQRLNCTTASDITGIAPPTGTGSVHVDGRMIRLVSVGTATVRLMHNDTGSTAANRMFHHNSTNVSLTVNEWADLVYDSTDNGSGAAGWRVVHYA
jgi:hypothetical protein